MGLLFLAWVKLNLFGFGSNSYYGIKESNSTIKKLQSNIIHYEESLYKIEQGGEIRNYKNELITADQYESFITETLKKMEYEIDKLAYFENALEEIGGNKFSKENIKVGYIVSCWGVKFLVGNVQYIILTGGAKGLGGSEPYAAIAEIIEATEEIKEIVNPFNIGDIVTSNSFF